jgi:NhaP-type Na+/H+ or K+/H+ antiporter
MNIGFGDALLIVGLLLAAAAALSGLMRGTVLSISVLSVIAGIVLASTDAISIDAGDNAVVHLVELALIVTLFSDGLYVERELLRMHWGPAARAIVIAMPVTLALLSVFAHLVFSELTWAEAFLLGAVLTPTDPVVTSAVVTAQRVPALVRHTLNLESGLNDGLALPFVLFFLVLAEPGGNAGHEGVKLLGESIAGAAIGVALAVFAGRLLSRLPGGGITRQYEGIYALGLCFAAFGLADVTIGNGLIAAFVAGIALGVAEHDVPDAFSEFNENVSAIFQVVTFFLFGALIVATGYDGEIWPLVAFVPFTLLLARPVAILAALGGSGLARPYKAFIAWFGPKGVASMLFALFVLNSKAPDRDLVFDIASFVILCSIVAHGLTDTLGTRWIERRIGEDRSDSDFEGVPGDLSGPT